MGWRPGASVMAAMLLTALAASRAQAGFTIGVDASQYALLFEGAGGNTLQLTNVAVNGNVGVGMTGKTTDSGPSTINGGIDFSAANTGQFSNNNGANVITGGVRFNVAAATNALNYVNSLNSSLGAETGASIVLTGNMTIKASDGVLDANGNRVFNVTSFNTTNSNVLTLVGDAAGDSVVFNFTNSANFNNQVVLSGLTADQVLWNFVGGSNLSGGPTLQINTNASSYPNAAAQGVFLDPNGAISVTNANVIGRVFGGDTHDFQYVSGSTITAPPTTVTPEPSTMILGLVGLFSMGLWASVRRKAALCPG